MYQACMYDDYRMETVAYGIGGAAFLIMIGMTGYEAFRDSKAVLFHFQDRLAIALNEFTKEINAEFLPKGVMWKFNDITKCLELQVQTYEDRNSGKHESHRKRMARDLGYNTDPMP